MVKILDNRQHLYFIYDSTFEGLLTCIFDAFDTQRFPFQILKEEQPLLFAENYEVITDQEKADRVLAGLRKKLSLSATNMLFTCWLSESEEIEMLLFRYICKAFKAPTSIELNFADSDVLELSKIYQKVRREAEKIRQFVRFQKTTDQIYFAAIEPQYNVLPLNADFFQDRFADQQWIIYDLKRKYALYYDLQKTEVVQFDDLKIDKKNGRLHPNIVAEDELDFQGLWKQYLRAITIKERKNLKLQRQHMSKRFWKYLTEKQ